MYAFFLFSFVKYQFYIHLQNKYQLGGSSTRPPIGSSPLDPTWWLSFPRIPSPLRQSILQSYRAVDATGNAGSTRERTMPSECSVHTCA